jgi:hypothetical protein
MRYKYEIPQDAMMEFFGFADLDVNCGSDLTVVTSSPGS